MRKIIFTGALLGLLLTASPCIQAAKKHSTSHVAPSSITAASSGGDSIVIIFKDGHQQSFSLSSIANIEFKEMPAETQSEPESSLGPGTVKITGSLPALAAGREGFLGDWAVRPVNGADFFITLSENGQASKTIGVNHGTWTFTNGEAIITWEDGIHDVIRKNGQKYEDRTYAAGKALSGTPSLTSDAVNTTPELHQ